MLLFSVHKKLFKQPFSLQAVFYSAGCQNDDTVLQDWTKKVVMQEEAIQVASYLRQDGKLRAKLKAPLMIRVAGDTISVESPTSCTVIL
ncbi:MAG: hypothetical protein IPQ25_11320 [Chitinophagaceae bacterium]|nr:hypothetical protein [Chitinophagaceae bacterium]